MESIRRLVAVCTVVGVLAVTPAAFAQSTGDGYGGQGGGIAGQISDGAGDRGAVAGQLSDRDGGAVAGEVSDEGGVLAFTGLDLALIVGGGLLLLISGVGLSRVVARNPA